MPDTMQMIVAGVRTLLRRVSDIKLSDGDIKERADRLLRSYTQDMVLSARDHKTRVVEVEFDELDIAGEYLVSGIAVPDFEPEKLEYTDTVDAPTSWREARIVPLATWGRQMNEGYVAVSFYDWNKRIRCNLIATAVSALSWRLAYREPLLTILLSGDRPLLPSAHIPMFEMELAIACIPLVLDTSAEWLDWVARAVPGWNDELGDRESPKGHTLRGRWRAYLDASVEPQIMDVRRSDRHRRGGRVNTRGYLPRQ